MAAPASSPGAAAVFFAHPDQALVEAAEKDRPKPAGR
jgi:hypothetical protein